MARFRRLTRFGLRATIAFVAIASLFFAWYVYRVDTQREAVEWVISHGGNVRYSYELDSQGQLASNKERSALMVWLSANLGNDFFYPVACVEIRDSDVENLDPISSFHGLQTLVIEDSPVGDLSVLAHLDHIQILRLKNLDLDDVTAIESLNELSILEIWGLPIDDLSPLSDLQNLKIFVLINSNVVDPMPLANLPNLTLLMIDDCAISDSKIEMLKSSQPNCSIYVNR